MQYIKLMVIYIASEKIFTEIQHIKTYLNFQVKQMTF